ncbi:hypothetical protein HDV00_001470 [Rhizophlyctis rosea]|nr:hypothetical protein HDV00_001470 [Rhizophlyctis rosea]
MSTIQIGLPPLVRTLRAVSLLGAGLFTGAALYITVAEVPARAERPAETARGEFQTTFPRALRLQAPLAVITAFTAGGYAYVSNQPLLYVPCGLFAAMLLVTLLLIRPHYERLMDKKEVLTAEQASSIMTKWGTNHAIRTVLSIVGFAFLATI